MKVGDRILVKNLPQGKREQGVVMGCFIASGLKFIRSITGHAPESPESRGSLGVAPRRTVVNVNVAATLPS